MPPQPTLRERPGSVDLVVRSGRAVWAFVAFMGLVGLAPASFLIAVFVGRGLGYLPTVGVVHGVLFSVLLTVVQVRCVLRVELMPTSIRFRRPLWSRPVPIAWLGAVTVAELRCRPVGETVRTDAKRDPTSGKLNCTDVILYRFDFTVWCQFRRKQGQLMPDGPAMTERLQALLTPAGIPVRHMINWTNWDPDKAVALIQPWDRNPSL